MMLISVDYHPSFQQIAFFVEETGECGELKLNHSEGESRRAVVVDAEEQEQPRPLSGVNGACAQEEFDRADIVRDVR
jgi:hypothetical protein